MALSTARSSSKAQIKSSLSRWQGGIDAVDLPLFRAFVEETLNRLRGPFLAHHAPMHVLAYLEEAFQFALRREPETISVELRPRPTKGLAVFSNMNDQPFIVDTIRLLLRAHRADYWGGFNLVFRAERDDEGRLTAVGTKAGTAESMVMLESDTGSLTDDLARSQAALHANLTLAHAMVRDFPAMTRAVERFVERCEDLAASQPDRADALRETASFLKWLLRENYVFMGVDAGDPLGIQTIRGRYFNSPDGEWAQPHFPSTVRVRKSHTESPVHRSGRIDEILVQVGNDANAMQLYMRGMFTYRAVTQPSRHVPILRRVLADILEDQTSGPGSFRYKGIANVFDSLPTEFLFTATRQAIGEMVDLVFESEQQQEVGVTFLMNGQDSAFCLVAMPKTQFSDELRRDLEEQIVGTLSATYTDHGLFVGRYDTVLLYYYLTGVRNPGDAAVQDLTETIRGIATPWLARLWDALAERFGEAKADRLSDTYGRAFPEDWLRSTSAKRAVRDIELLEALAARRRVLADMFQVDGDLTLRVYQASDVHLSDLMPVLGNFGVQVIDSYSTRVNSRGGFLHIDTFRLQTDEDGEALLLERGPLLTEALDQVFAGQVTDDALNGLTLAAGLSWRQVDLVRAYARYTRQLRVSLTPSRLTEILLANPEMVSSLVALFEARFDPDLQSDREAAVAAADEQVIDELRYILTHDEDLAFAAIRTLINATIRTNVYRTDRPHWYVSFKFDCSRVPYMGPTRPMVEIFVHSRDVEGVHLRFGPVARGGLRWSDRDDYRTEILGLATTQQVKNVVIVPTGSKGGFYLKQASRDSATRRQQADNQYKTFIRGLLDLTDNSVDGAIVKPPRVVCRDGDDPYLVVAADKGTAHLSDTANAISEAYGFWLGDAFASGGSNGYDHKKVGITARGGWVLVRRHFAEMGSDPYTQPFTCAAVGDMAGDVFGNGMIESKQTKLLAAFNHLHVFFDPDPDPIVSYAERVRLFDSRGGWDAYNTQTISEGGGVYDRRAKSMPLSPQVQKLLGLQRDEARPEEVIKHILKMDVDLLWNGGIGTYVKASHETHADADDRSNNEVRIDATELRAKILGEGGNLGLTHQARIEAGLHGVRLNTDAIDNSGGVDMSDHEVNLKILVNRVVARGDLTPDARNAVLEEMTEEVAGLVLANNDAHGRQLSRDQLRSTENVFAFGRAIAFVERVFGRTPYSLNLPDDEELERRSELGLGLTRPELAVLSAWVKMYVYTQLMAGTPKSLPGYDNLLMSYFPERIQASYEGDIRGHMLADEIAMTMATSCMVADAGAAFFPMVIEATGSGVSEIAESYLKAQRLAEAAEVRGTLEELRTSVSLDSLYRAWVMVDAGAREVALYWLSARGTVPDDDTVAVMIDAAAQVYDLQATEVVARNRELFASLLSADIPEPVAASVLRAQYLNIALTVWAEAKRSNEPFGTIAVRHLAIGRASRLQDVLDDLSTRPASGRWDPIAMRILHARFHTQLRNLVGRCPINDLAGTSVDVLAPKLVAGPLADVRSQVVDLLPADESPSISALVVLEERVAAAIRRL